MVNWSPVKLLLNPTLLLNVVAPVVAYGILSKLGLGEPGALAVSAVFPAAAVALAVRRRRRLDPVAALSLTAIAVGLIAALAFHDGRLLLVKESLTAGALGLVFLGSLGTSRPLFRVLRQRLSASDAPGEGRVETAVWGVALLAEAALRVGLSYLVPTGTMVAVSPLVAPVVLGPVALWTLRPRRRRPARRDLPAAESRVFAAEFPGAEFRAAADRRTWPERPEFPGAESLIAVDRRTRPVRPEFPGVESGTAADR